MATETNPYQLYDDLKHQMDALYDAINDIPCYHSRLSPEKIAILQRWLDMGKKIVSQLTPCEPLEKPSWQQINDALNLRASGCSIITSKLSGFLFIGNDDTIVLYSENKLPLSLTDFESCTNTADIQKRFNEALGAPVFNQLLNKMPALEGKKVCQN
jgi:hypothetical protein